MGAKHRTGWRARTGRTRAVVPVPPADRRPEPQIGVKKAVKRVSRLPRPDYRVKLYVGGEAGTLFSQHVPAGGVPVVLVVGSIVRTGAPPAHSSRSSVVGTLAGQWGLPAGVPSTLGSRVVAVTHSFSPANPACPGRHLAASHPAAISDRTGPRMRTVPRRIAPRSITHRREHPGAPRILVSGARPYLGCGASAGRSEPAMTSESERGADPGPLHPAHAGRHGKPERISQVALQQEPGQRGVGAPRSRESRTCGTPYRTG